MTCYPPDSLKTLSGGVVMGFTLSIKWFLLGGCRPPDPLLFLGGFQPPGLQPPVPPCIPRGSASRALRRSWYQDLGTKILVPRSWYQDLRRAREAEPLGMQGGTGGCRPGGWKPPRKSRGSGGRQPPSKNHFIDKVKPITTPPDKVFKLSGG